MSYKILVVDDEPANLRILERLFRHDFEIVSAASGIEALELLRLHNVALILSDQRMPGMTGVEFLKRASEMRPHTVRLLLTGYTDVGALFEAINSGVVYKYVAKPWTNEDLRQTVGRALEHYETVKAQYDLKNQNERLQSRLKATRDGFVRVVAEMLDMKDPLAPGHARRTSSYAVAVGQALGLDRAELERLSLAGFLHEAAEVGVPNEILFKTGAPTSEERRLMKENFERGLRLLGSVPDLEDVAWVVRYYRERWDGAGFPEGLQGEQIPLHSRIVAVADAYDQMTTRHPLRPGCTHDEAVARLQAEAGRKFDPAVVKAFCELKSIGQSPNAPTPSLANGTLSNNSPFVGAN
jgi:putative two-component system response regulator